MMDETKSRNKRNNAEDGDQQTSQQTAKKLKVASKSRSADDEDDEPGMDVEDESVLEDDEPEPQMAPAGQSTKHIHPCICDLSTFQKKRIRAFHRHRSFMQVKYDKRVKEIEEELAQMEEERLEREREEQEQEELFGDEYEVVGKKKKRKKRSARRASMVSLGVKQVINWRKQPKHQVKMNTTSTLRKKYTMYCGRVFYILSPPRPVDYHKEPGIQIRSTVTSDSRSKVNIAKKNYLIKHEDKRPRFETPYYT